jgi:hypothetical protein
VVAAIATAQKTVMEGDIVCVETIGNVESNVIEGRVACDLLNVSIVFGPVSPGPTGNLDQQIADKLISRSACPEEES